MDQATIKSGAPEVTALLDEAITVVRWEGLAAARLRLNPLAQAHLAIHERLAAEFAGT